MTLDYDVLVTLPPRAVLPDGTAVRPIPAWSPIASTLIYGERDAILIDAPHTAEKAREVADWVVASGKNLVAMYATHGHGDHWFGFTEVAKRFPGVPILGTAGTVALAQEQATNRMDFWTSQFPGQIVENPILPSVIKDQTFILESHEIHFVEAGDSDTQDTTFVHVPSLGLVVAGDIVYNGVHLFLAGGDAQRRADWIAAIDKIAALKPTKVVAGHKAPGSDDDPHNLDQTRQYLQDADEIQKTARHAKEFADLMTLRHLSRINPTILGQSAEHLFPGTTVM
ncbi:MBL fold metallo-hydrolase [Herbiconiux sp. CPCC 205763]|uniref:MBL fold metallo-hydrolase n=1 Tax=Herbiconiux aconitum TaxID=2970913 RepID=A0ABT2GQV3_9MICO|nr:MBL fold metallo-hydrolase [Herbiconiux aconitum]MCS5717675.1 MBL fold metallo-hydrolase [Herbiconiux aconitum]